MELPARPGDLPARDVAVLSEIVSDVDVNCGDPHLDPAAKVDCEHECRVHYLAPLVTFGTNNLLMYYLAHEMIIFSRGDHQMNGFQILARVVMHLESQPASFDRDEAIVNCYACEGRLYKAMRAGEPVRVFNFILEF